MQVIKLGGSLNGSNAILKCLNIIAEQARTPVVIVAGGGEFAEQVRLAQKQWLFDDTTAHAMAILAMQQTALMLAALQPEFKVLSSVSAIQQAITTERLIIWSPQIDELNQAQLPATWELTSDSLSAWLAGQLTAQKLLIVKAATVPTNDIKTLQQLGILDQAFSSFIQETTFKLLIIHHSLLCHHLS